MLGSICEAVGLQYIRLSVALVGRKDFPLREGGCYLLSNERIRGLDAEVGGYVLGWKDWSEVALILFPWAIELEKGAEVNV